MGAGETYIGRGRETFPEMNEKNTSGTKLRNLEPHNDRGVLSQKAVWLGGGRTGLHKS